jgi:hypothetical protein
MMRDRIAELEAALNLASASYAGERERADALQARTLTVELPTAYDLTGETDGNCSLNEASMNPDVNGCYFIAGMLNRHAPPLASL